MATTRDELTKFMAWLVDNERYDEQAERYYWPLDHPYFPGEKRSYSSTCTVGAALVAQRFQGTVMGYMCVDNPQAVVGRDVFGHDFAIVDQWLVDWWAWHISAEIPRPILHLQQDAALILSHYGPSACWKPTLIKGDNNQ